MPSGHFNNDTSKLKDLDNIKGPGQKVNDRTERIRN
jgi:hypothetical protein